jgi:DNA adenine methylase
MKTSSRSRPIRPAIKWHGGKGNLKRWIASLLPAHTVYVEPYAGGLSVLLNKYRSAFEVVGDIDTGLIGLYVALRDEPKVLIERLRSIPCVEESFAWATSTPEASDPIERAARFVVRYRFSRGGLGKSFSWSDRPRGNQAESLNSWETILAEELPRIARRIQRVEFLQGDAIELIRRHDGPDTLFYLDPPYVHSTRTARNVYRHELAEAGHCRLLETISAIRGMVALSGYRSELYDHALQYWERHEIERPNDSGQGKTKQRRTEVLWLNPACDRFSLTRIRELVMIN